MSFAPSRARRSLPPDRIDRRAAALFAAAAALAGVVERHYRIAGQGVRLRFAGEEMLTRVGGSFEHLASGPVDVGLTINVWDSASTRTEAPVALPGTAQDDEGGPVEYYEHDGVQAVSRWRTLSVLGLDGTEAFFWAPAATAMLSWDWAAPLRAILHWWLGRRGILQVHGGAVGLPDAGALVVGKGGSGKSTTALACLVAGLRYAGDDYVAISTHPGPRAHSLYCSGKLDAGHLERFPALLPAVANPERSAAEKAIVDVQRALPGAAIAALPLRAVLVPRVVARVPQTRVVPTTAAAALAALAPSTIFQLHPPQPGALAEMAALVRSVPCFSVELGSDVDRIPEAIVELLEAGG